MTGSTETYVVRVGSYLIGNNCVPCPVVACHFPVASLSWVSSNSQWSYQQSHLLPLPSIRSLPLLSIRWPAIQHRSFHESRLISLRIDSLNAIPDKSSPSAMGFDSVGSVSITLQLFTKIFEMTALDFRRAELGLSAECVSTLNRLSGFATRKPSENSVTCTMCGRCHVLGPKIDAALSFLLLLFAMKW